ncbi:MAG: hypothetical protein PHC88_07670 [Terrimicrobiaceae bacterium]|nr:hypothetical protein [Terrimicrobiaceae bacterium]
MAFLQSMASEKQAARSYLNRYRAQLASTAAADAAKQLIFDTISDAANLATARQPASPYTYKVNFVTWAYSPNGTTFAPFYTGILSNAIPASSGGTGTQAITDVSRTVWLASDPANEKAPSVTDPSANASDPNLFSGLGPDVRCNINFPMSTRSGVKHYWIDQSGTAYPVGWVKVTSSDPQLTIRYAFWVDDEMGRADLRALGHGDQQIHKDTVYKGLPTDLVVNQSGDQSYFSNADAAKIAIDTNRELVGMSPLTAKQLVAKSTADQLTQDTVAVTTSPVPPTTTPSTSPTIPSVYDLIPYGPQAGKPKLNLNDQVALESDPVRSIATIRDFIRTSLPQDPSGDPAYPKSVFFNRKNSPPGNLWRIAASIHDYISPADYPTLAPALQKRFNDSIGAAYDFIIKRKMAGAAPGIWDPRWDNIAMETPDKTLDSQVANTTDGRWYGIKPVPFIHAFDMNLTLSGKTCTATYDFWLWNPSDTQSVSLANCYIMVFKTPFCPFSPATTTGGLSVEGLPYYPYDIFEIPSAQQGRLNPAELRKITISNTGSKAYQTNETPPGSPPKLQTGNQMGMVLFRVDGSGVIRVLDGYFTSDAFGAASKAPAATQSYASAGGVDSGTTDWDTKDRRQSLALSQTTWFFSSTPFKGSLANFQQIGRWYDGPANYTTSSSDPITHIALAPMKSIGELGNIFDPVNDVKVATKTTGGRISGSDTPSGNRISRGGKTLTVGQFDDFFDNLQTGNPANPAAAAVSHWTSAYEKYLRLADSVLLDIFTTRSASDYQVLRPLNLNTPRPGASSGPSLSPLSTYLGSLAGHTVKDATGTAYQLQALKAFQDAIRQRLSGSDWKKCLPFRNAADLTLLGIPKESLSGSSPPASIPLNIRSKSLFAGNTAGHFTKNPKLNSITFGDNVSTTTVLKSRNSERQAPFAALAEQTTFRSYRYRIYAVGQVLRNAPAGSTAAPVPISTVYQCFTYDLNPVYDPADPNDPVKLHPKLQRVVDY